MVNRLAGEASPYLLQHARNPVDWYPWGPEALGRAQSEDKPILLSIGYSACHWCHVMERESFESEAIAQLMNALFVSIKVDREERPDLDHVYQLVVQLMGRSGGWPLTVFLTPDQRPFFGGTYFPPSERYGMPGFPKVLQAVAEAFRERRGEVDAQAGQMAETIRQATDVRARGEGASAGAAALTREAVATSVEKLSARFDEEHGGFGRRPKFPGTMALDLLLREGDTRRVHKALFAMRTGGIFDQLGGGFHRYSTDERWLVPHFEKMLYDNALLMRLYADSWRRTGSALYAGTVRDIAAYVAREMTSPDGGFYSTQDADSEGEEGRFFVWRPAEVDAACGDDSDAARVAKLAFGVTSNGNFEDSGATVLSRPAPMDDVAKALGIPESDARAALDRARQAMTTAREGRPKPFRDEKILASWNGLMAGALASAGAALGDESMVHAAQRALDFVTKTLVVSEGGGTKALRVLRHVKDGVTRGPGFLDDYAFVADAALDVYAATGEPRWVRLSEALVAAILAHFYDEGDSSFFFTPGDGEAILVRPKDPFDNAVPGGASVACRVLLRLGALLGGPYAAIAERAIEKAGGAALANPQGMPVTVALVDRLVRGSVDVVLVGAADSEALVALAQAAQKAYVRDLVLAWADPKDPERRAVCAALAEGKPAHEFPVAYVCKGRTCSRPIADPDELAQALLLDSPVSSAPYAPA